ncbi:MAG: hypothetical protein ACOCQR_02120 [bacterium]
MNDKVTKASKLMQAIIESREWAEDSIFVYNINFTMEDNEINIKQTAFYGFDVFKTDNEIFNACDFTTNIEGATKFVLEFVNYLKEYQQKWEKKQGEK